MLELIKGRADQMFNKEDFAAAGSLYALLIKTVPNSISRKLDMKTLNQRMKTCQKSLFESGLERYRSGDLNDAIFHMEEHPCVFDPDHRKLKKALDMAMLQLKNLARSELQRDLAPSNLSTRICSCKLKSHQQRSSGQVQQIQGCWMCSRLYVHP